MINKNKIVGILCYALLCIGNQSAAEISDCSTLWHKARAEYLLGSVQESHETLLKIIDQDPCHSEANQLLAKIQEVMQLKNRETRTLVKGNMLKEVDDAWRRPEYFLRKNKSEIHESKKSDLRQKIDSMIIPEISLNDTTISEALLAITEILKKVDVSSPKEQRGVNFALIDPDGLNPKVDIQLKNIKLSQLVNILVKSVNFSYEIEDNVVIIRDPHFSSEELYTEFFPITRASIIKMTGNNGDCGMLCEEEGVSSQLREEIALRSFFERAGVPFSVEYGGPLGASVAFDGTQLIITQTSKNIDRVRNILRHYAETRQVEIEAKFIEVQEGALEELGFKWSVSSGDPNRYYRTENNLRTLGQAFEPRSRKKKDAILSTSTPVFPHAINLGTGSVSVGSVLGIINQWNINVIINALEQHTGSDLMSAPKLTVLSGKTAKITIAQRFRYPESFGDVQSAVGSAGANPDSSAAGVTITAGTPRHFVEEKVGVEMKVTPTVETDNRHINLRLDPRVTEFEGFVEYGGDSIALSGKREVRIPSGFIQPIFSTREISTELTIEDGATVVMGGLTREEVRQVKDRVPVLGSVPLLGRLFRSKGEAYQKKNLLIFVTANLISSGGGIERQCQFPFNSEGLFKNPVVITPGGSLDREIQ